MLISDRSIVLQSHEYGASVLIGDECGRLTAIAWEFDRGQGIFETPPGLNGAVRVTKVDMGVVSLAFTSLTPAWNAPLTCLVVSAIIHQPPVLVARLPLLGMRGFARPASVRRRFQPNQ